MLERLGRFFVKPKSVKDLEQYIPDGYIKPLSQTSVTCLKRHDKGYSFKINDFKFELVEIWPKDGDYHQSVKDKILKLKPKLVLTDSPGLMKFHSDGPLKTLTRNFIHAYTCYRYDGYKEMFYNPVFNEKSLRLIINNTGSPIIDIGPSYELISGWLIDDIRYKWTYDFIENSALTEVIRSIPTLPTRTIPFDHAIKLYTLPPRTTPHTDVYDVFRFHPYFIERLQSHLRDHFLPLTAGIVDGIKGKNGDESFMIVTRKLFALILARELDKLCS